MLDDRRSDASAESARRVRLSAPGGNRVTKDLSDYRSKPPCGFELAARLDAFQNSEDFGRGDFLDRTIAEGWGSERQKPFRLADGGAGFALATLLFGKFRTDRRERFLGGAGLLESWPVSWPRRDRGHLSRAAWRFPSRPRLFGGRFGSPSRTRTCDHSINSRISIHDRPGQIWTIHRLITSRKCGQSACCPVVS